MEEEDKILSLCIACITYQRHTKEIPKRYQRRRTRSRYFVSPAITHKRPI